MSLLRLLVAGGLALSLTAAYAQTTTGSTATNDKKPLDQARTSVEKNLEKDPDNKGLQNAAERLKENQERIEARKNEKRERSETAKVERAERPSRPEAPQRPEKLERPARQ